MFNQSKYVRIYYSIIDNAKGQDRSKKKGYFENHHIIPKSLGGENTESNKILLTFKEHYICHRLLCKMVNDATSINKMKYALYCLTRSNSEQERSMSFHQKMICYQANREASKTRNHKPNLGNKHSPETIERLRQASTGRKHSDETIQKLIDGNARTKGIRSRNISIALKGRNKSDNHRQALSESSKLAWQKRKSGA